MHGEGVAIGMMGAARLAQRLGMIPQEVVDRQRRLLERFNLPVKAQGVSIADIRQAMSLDKKVQWGANRWVLLEDVGRAVVRQDVPWSLVEETLQELVD
jgi:3-dehydroquinate synthase